MIRRGILLNLLLFVTALAAIAKDQPTQIVVWPESGSPTLRFTFGKFKELGSMGRERTYQTDTTAENLSNKLISNANFYLYLFDKNKVRIGEGWITLSNIAPGQTVRFQTTVSSLGTPVSVSLATPSTEARIVTITVNSVPQGALVKLDGKDVGTTPKLVEVSVGKHILRFSKEGFNSGNFPLEIGPNDVSGGSVSYELGQSAHATFELRDGSVLTGDLESLSAMDVTVRVGGTLQHLNRNQIKRILLVERDAPAQ